MKKKKKLILILILLLIACILTGYVANTYAKYVSEVSGNGTASVAKWAFDTDNSITTFNIDLSETYDASTLVANKIAPGTSGSFAINLVNTNSETGVDFEVELGNITNVPTNLKFYDDSTYTNEIIPGTSKITGQLVAGDSTGVEVKFYWKWAFETGTESNEIVSGDAIDTSDGKAAQNLTLPVVVKGVQTAPSTVAITSHFN